MTPHTEAGRGPDGAHGFAVAALSGREGALAAIYERRAVRAYTDEPVARDQIKVLLDAAIHAPSAVNSQPWAFVVIQEPELLTRYDEEAGSLFLAEPPAAEVANSGLPALDALRKVISSTGYVLFHHAPALVVIYSTSAGGVSDCFLAAENLMLAAWAIGLGTCPIGLATPLFNQPEVKAELGISPEWSVALPIVAGHPSGQVPPTTRQPVHVVTWR